MQVGNAANVSLKIENKTAKFGSLVSFQISKVKSENNAQSRSIKLICHINIIAGLPSKYPYIYNNQSYVLKDVKEKGKSKGWVEESTNPNYLITLHFERN